MSSSQSKPQLKLDWCSHEAAKYAVEHWHYSKCLPAGKAVKVGVWEDGSFIGCVIFSRGANVNMLRPYGLHQIEGCELTRIALNGHRSTVSRIMTIAIKMLRKLSPRLRLIVSYSDKNHGHYGGIYQACNWIYSGVAEGDAKVLLQGRLVHRKTVYSKFGTDAGAKRVQLLPKYRYLYPLDDEMKQRILPLSKPYPKKPRATSIEGDASSDPTGRGGINATVALQEVIYD